MPVTALRRSRQPGREGPGVRLHCHIRILSRFPGDVSDRRHGARR